MIDPARPPWREPRSGHGRLEPVPFYRPRNPRATPLWKLAETHYERLRGEWEKRFEARFGFWRGLADEAVARYLDCGIPEMGFGPPAVRHVPPRAAADLLTTDAAALPPSFLRYLVEIREVVSTKSARPS